MALAASSDIRPNKVAMSRRSGRCAFWGHNFFLEKQVYHFPSNHYGSIFLKSGELPWFWKSNLWVKPHHSGYKVNLCLNPSPAEPSSHSFQFPLHLPTTSYRQVLECYWARPGFQAKKIMGYHNCILFKFVFYMYGCFFHTRMYHLHAWCPWKSERITDRLELEL